MITKAESLSADIFGGSKKELDLFIQETIRYRRLQNQVQILERVKEIMVDNNIAAKQLDLKVLIPLLEGISLEEDEDLKAIWANLFVNYVDSDKNLRVTVYPNILRQLSSEEAKILDGIKSNDGEAVDFSDFMIHTDYGDSLVRNMERLGLIEEIPKTITMRDLTRDKENVKHQVIENSMQYNLTIFGIHFLEACKR